MRIELPIVGFLCTVLVLMPLPWHWQARNVSVVSVLIWLALFNFTNGINAIIWGGNVVIRYKIWCDVTSKLLIGANIGLPSSVMCICHHLAQVSSPYRAIQITRQKRERMRFDIWMCIGLPILIMVLHYVVQGHRFDIIEDIGCYPTFYISVPALFIIHLPPLIISLISLLYAGVALRWFIHRHVQFRQTLLPDDVGITRNRYVRLIVLSVIQMTFSTSMSLFILVINLQEGVQPWTSWDDVHYNWMNIRQYSRAVMPEYKYASYMMVWYIIPISSVLCFGFFGLGDEAIAEYEKSYKWIGACICLIKPQRIVVLPTGARDVAMVLESSANIPPETDTTGTLVRNAEDEPPSMYPASRSVSSSHHKR